MSDNARVAEVFKSETGLDALKVFRIGLNAWMIEASDGNTYKMS